MGYWQDLQARYKIQDRKNHPWASLFVQTLRNVDPVSYAELDGDGDLDAFASVKVHSAIVEIRALRSQGWDYEAAKEHVFEDLLPKPQDETVAEDWEQEGGQEDAIAGFSKWIGTYDAGSQSQVDTERQDATEPI